MFRRNTSAGVVAPILISQCYNIKNAQYKKSKVVAPILISQCYNNLPKQTNTMHVVAPILISQCYNVCSATLTA